MKTVKEVSNITKVSVRTLHYYDEIGLLQPAKISNSGYRLYDDENLQTLQQILFFKELNFSLKEIKEIISNPNFDRTKALISHKELLKAKMERFNNLIHLIDGILKGETDMSFKQFDNSEIQNMQKQYQSEAKEKYGNTEAFIEYENKTSKYGKCDWKRINDEAEEIYKGFIENMDKGVESGNVQCLVKDWQKYISKNFYNCTIDILEGLGQMYVSDERFTKNIDKYKSGLALFMSKAIEIYCKNNH